MLVSIKHSKVLPTRLNSHQVKMVGDIIHDRVSEVVTPLAESKPHYQAITLTLGSLKEALDQMDLAHNQRKFKSARAMRAVSGMDGLSGARTLSVKKRQVSNRRKSLIRRLRNVIAWKLEDIALNPAETGQAAAEIIDVLLDKRMNDFESQSYEEATLEFKYFINSFSTPEAEAAMAELGHAALYDQIKAAHDEFMALHLAQTQLDADLEESPKVGPTTREVRQIVKVLLTMMHFDLSSGDPTLNGVMGQIDEAIDKVRAVSKRRNTLSEQVAAKADAKKGDDKNAGDQSGDSKTADGTSANAGDKSGDQSDQSGDHTSPDTGSDSASNGDATDAANRATGGETPADAGDQTAGAKAAASATETTGSALTG